MNNTTETKSTSSKFVPMPLSALLANLKPLQQEEDTPDSSFNNESDDSADEVNTKCFAPTKAISTSTPQNAKTASKVVDERKVHSERNKDNIESNGTSHQTYPNSQFQNPFQGPHAQKTPSTYLNSERKKYGLISHDKYSNTSSYRASAFKRTPDMQKLSCSTQKTKTATPKIKSDIRKFTPGSSTRKSQKKTPLQTIIQNRDKVRCELFRHPLNSDPVDPVTPSSTAIAGPKVPMTSATTCYCLYLQHRSLHMLLKKPLQQLLPLNYAQPYTYSCPYTCTSHHPSVSSSITACSSNSFKQKTYTYIICSNSIISSGCIRQ